jgi:hypothetical protein
VKTKARMGPKTPFKGLRIDPDNSIPKQPRFTPSLKTFPPFRFNNSQLLSRIRGNQLCAVVLWRTNWELIGGNHSLASSEKPVKAAVCAFEARVFPR